MGLAFAVSTKSFLHRQARAALALLPRGLRFAAYRHFVHCEYQPDSRLRFKIADTRAELEACFALLHDAYVGNRERTLQAQLALLVPVLAQSQALTPLGRARWEPLHQALEQEALAA